MGYKPEREIRSVLHDRSEVVFDTGERIVFVAARPGGIPLAVDPDSIVDDLIISLEQKDKEIAKLKELSIRWERAFDKADKQYLKKEKALADLGRRFNEFEKNSLNLLNEKSREIKQLKEALEWYADKDNYDPIHISIEGWIPIDKDEGARARTALSHLKG